jgi:hypothetical protein
MIVTPAQAGVQCKDAWIPACAGMTGGQYSLLLNIILENSSRQILHGKSSQWGPAFV